MDILLGLHELKLLKLPFLDHPIGVWEII